MVGATPEQVVLGRYIRKQAELASKECSSMASVPFSASRFLSPAPTTTFLAVSCELK